MSLRFIYYIPWGVLIVINAVLLTIIFLLNVIGKSVVWLCNHLARYGDKMGTLAHTDEKLDALLEKVKTAKQQRTTRKRRA